MGRKAKTLTEKQKAEVETLAAFLSAQEIADYLGIARSTFFKMKDADEEINGLYKKGRAKAVATVAQSLVKSAIGGCTTSKIFYLKTQAGWSEKQDEKRNSDAPPLNINFSVSEAKHDIQITEGKKEE